MKFNTRKTDAKPAKKPEPKKAENKPKQTPVSSGGKYALPTQILVKEYELTDLIILLYGEKKIGKTSLAVQFPDSLFFNCEKGTRGVDCMEVDIKDWRDFKGYLDSLEKAQKSGELPYKSFAIDTADKLYQMCFNRVCSDEGMEHPSELSFGKGWALVNDEFTKQLDRLIALRKGIVFISHATEKEYLERGGGKYDKIVPTMTKQCMAVVNGIADIMIFYGYFGSKRVLSIRGMDSLESGTRMKKNFWVKGKYEEGQKLIKELLSKLENETATEQYLEDTVEKIEKLRVQTIPAGISEEQTYFNLNLAFKNGQKNNGGKAAGYAPNIEKLAMQQKKNK